jgi:hypothetical protein
MSKDWVGGWAYYKVGFAFIQRSCTGFWYWTDKDLNLAPIFDWLCAFGQANELLEVLVFSSIK